MSPRRRQPRPDAIDLLCGGVPVPLAALKEFQIEAIMAWIARAWADVVTDHAVRAATDEEDAVTFFLLERLRTLLDEDEGGLANLVAQVDRLACPNYNGQELTKQPDLSIVLTDRGRNFPLHVEAKIIDPGKGVSRYCEKGLIRFVNGDYGWARSDGMMIAYVRKAATIASALSGFLKGREAVYETETPPTAVVYGGSDAAWSRHGRSFSYQHGDGGRPGAITVWHLWLAIQLSPDRSL